MLGKTAVHISFINQKYKFNVRVHVIYDTVIQNLENSFWETRRIMYKSCIVRSQFLQQFKKTATYDFKNDAK